MLWYLLWKWWKNLPPAFRRRIYIWMALMRVPTAKEQSRVELWKDCHLWWQVRHLWMPFSPSVTYSGSPGWISYILLESLKNEAVLKKVKAHTYVAEHTHTNLSTYIYIHIYIHTEWYLLLSKELQTPSEGWTAGARLAYCTVLQWPSTGVFNFLPEAKCLSFSTGKTGEVAPPSLVTEYMRWY